MTRALGMTGLPVSRITHGTWELSGHWGAFDEDEAIAALRHARELGVNTFDSAHAYGWGRAERILGRALRDDLTHRRDEIVLVTKGGLRITDDGRLQPDSSPQWLREGIESSLGALGVEHIDVYLVHVADPTVPIADVAGFLQRYVEAGTIRHVGVSNFSAQQIGEFAAALPAEVLQSPYSLFRREIAQAELPYAREHDIGVMGYSPLANGLLGGTLTEDHVFAGDWRGGVPFFQGEQYRQTLRLVSRLADFARTRYDVTVAQLAVAWALANTAVDTVVVGTRQAKHIQDAVRATEVRLDASDLAEIDRQLSASAGPDADPAQQS
ncbi:aldo/keto reductase [Dactylosporangium sp. CA-139066]|uniref:aldo/keto reductase n=1 Tax=Dactylosporangium sp. CA-139066 TaxID=3239930 RepID=UPI003D926D90